eukprot:Plantae.Rhodophyta-Purpureofilum_apyrenoidigerum.ctg2605.p1 GENE.Plantae.Rhodophyta-Purpureofilum_apyrenoidigerum.ctg2605~~Plantae.Rhodophyta-Purpureofilum_apyrenoidigerum.ctg2605.p1  ORF type:complete len:504 (-),score=92.22 Plantae.Rhodophyta-Purpureofilum_apyrenoidigerum.ctg2605:53-1564(-)
MTALFDVASYFISLREVLEMGLVFGIVLAYLKKTGNDHLKKFAYWSAGLAALLSLALGVAVGVLYHRSDSTFLSGSNRTIFESIVYLVAAVLLTWMIIWMMRVGKHLKNHMEANLDRVLSTGNGWSIFILVFVHLFREGVELVILLLGVDNNGNWKSTLIPAIVGSITAVIVCFLLFVGFMQLNIGAFFTWSSVLLIMFCAGLFSRAFHEMQEVPWFGEYEEPYQTNTWWNFPLWNTVECCSDKDNQFFAMLRALFGYQDKPTFVELMTYFGYWVLITGVFIFLFWSDLKRKVNSTAVTVKLSSSFNWFVSFIGFIYVCINPTWNGLTVVTLYWVLSSIAVVGAFDMFSKWVLKSRRKLAMLTSSVGFALLAVYTVSLIVAQLFCRYPESKTCSVPEFYYWFLIFSEDWLTQPPKLNDSGDAVLYYIAGATLTMAIFLTIYIMGFQSLFSYLYATHVEEGGRYAYMESESANAKDISDLLIEKHLDTNTPPASNSPISNEEQV